MNEILLPVIFVVLAIAVVGSLAVLLVRGRRTPPGLYSSPRDPDDQVERSRRG